MKTDMTSKQWACHLRPGRIYVKHDSKLIGHYDLVKAPYCARCFRPDVAEENCGFHWFLDPALVKIRGVSKYFTTVDSRDNLMSRHVLLLKKYKDYAVPIALALGLIATTDKSEVDKCDLIAHVPIHVDKRKVRGFDQAEEIAIILSTLLNKPCSNALVKTQNIELHSAGGLMDRIVRVKGLYSCDEAFHGERILLVDDIATTGLDLAECAKILHEKGTSTVNGLVGGRTVFRI